MPGVCKALGLPNHLAETVEQDMGDPDFLAKPPEKVIKTGAIEEWGALIGLYIYIYII